MNASLQQWWLDRSDQEQRLLILLLPVVVAGLLYWLAWVPLAEGVEQAQRAVQAEQKALRSIKVNAERYISHRASQSPAQSGGSLNQIASRSAVRHGLAITRMQPQGDQLQLWLEDTQFERLLGWLSELENKDGVAVSALDLTKSDTAGRVQIRRLRLLRP